MAVDSSARTFGRVGDRLAAHVRTPLYREGYALVLSAGLASGLGLVYWIIAARAYDPAVVGLNSAAISAMMLLSGISQLNLVGGLVRFLPGAGRSTWRLVAWSYGISLLVSAVLSIAFLAGLDIWAPKLSFLSSGDAFALWFTASTMAWSVFTLQDAVLTGLQRAIWVPVDNTLFGLAKIGLLAAFATLFPRYGIFASWTFALAISLVPISVVLAARLLPAHVRSAGPAAPTATARQIGRYVAADYVAGLFWIASCTLVPLVITQRVGASANAFFSLAWVMMIPLYLVSANTGSSLVVSAVKEADRLREYAHSVLVQTARLVVPIAVILAAGAPFILRLFGEEYSEESSLVLQLLALSAIPNMVNVMYMSVWRAQRRMARVVVVRGVLFLIVVVGSLALLGPYGIRGAAIAWLFAQLGVSAALFLCWPEVLTGEGVRFQRGLGWIRVARNAAADVGLLNLAGDWKRRSARRRRVEKAERIVPRVLGELPCMDGDPPPTTWGMRVTAGAVTDRTVALVGPVGLPARAAIKVPESVNAARGLLREAEVLSRLSADPRLGGWCSFLPELLAVGVVGGTPYVAQSLIPGIDARRLLGRGVDRWEVIDAVAAAVEPLHRETRTELVVSGTMLRRWVDEPLAVVARHVRRETRGDRWRSTALEHLGIELRSELFGKRVSASWIHGDCAPGNVLFDPIDGTVSGIVDWELASALDLPLLDIVQLVLTTRMQTRRRELGEVVTHVLGESGWTDEERALLATARSRLPGDHPPWRVLVLLAWLRHSASMLTKARGYADNWLWRRGNLDPPLVTLA